MISERQSRKKWIPNAHRPEPILSVATRSRGIAKKNRDATSEILNEPHLGRRPQYETFSHKSVSSRKFRSKFIPEYPSACLEGGEGLYLPPKAAKSQPLSTPRQDTNALSPIVQAVAEGVDGGMIHELLHVSHPLGSAGSLAV